MRLLLSHCKTLLFGFSSLLQIISQLIIRRLLCIKTKTETKEKAARKLKHNRLLCRPLLKIKLKRNVNLQEVSLSL